jgi:hypothetical protein
MNGRCSDARLALGVYMLGAAEPAERALVHVHLAWCRHCREELAGLAGLPGLLRRVPAAQADELFAGEPEEAADADPVPPGVLTRLLDRTGQVRRARRRTGLAAAAAAVIIAAGAGYAVGGGVAAGGEGSPGGGVAAGGGGSPGGGGRGIAAGSHAAWRTASARNDRTLVSATVRYAPVAWGTDLEVTVGGIAPGTPCQLRVTDSDGRVRTAGGWTVVAGRHGIWIPASTSLPASSMRDFAVTAGGRTLVSVPLTAR